MSGSIGPRFSFTHYPQTGTANGPGATLLRPFPDPSAPFVNFLGMSPRAGDGPGFAFGTVGPILGEVGSSTARILVEVSFVVLTGLVETFLLPLARGENTPNIAEGRDTLARFLVAMK